MLQVGATGIEEEEEIDAEGYTFLKVIVSLKKTYSDV
jgi:hypothetical protein